MISFPALSVILFLPLSGSLLAMVLRRHPDRVRWVSLAVALADLALVLGLFGQALCRTAGLGGGWLRVEETSWIERFGIRYSLGLDGLSLLLILLTTFLTVLCVLVSWKQIDRRIGSFHFFLLFMETGILGVFLATDLFLFYLFWEVQVIPMFFLIGLWGHEDCIRATVKFVLFTLTGSLLMLAALIGLYLAHGSQTGSFTFALARLTETRLPPSTEGWLFATFFLAFAIKVPIIPVHTWLPDAHTEAPTAGSVILAGLLLKTGVYGLLRIAFPLFPSAARMASPLLLGLGLAGLGYGAWVALAQRDLKRLVAYSSVAHMGLVVVGIGIWTGLTLTGAALQMINHGLTTSALFILVGILDERTRSRQLTDLGGLWGPMPAFSAFFLFFFLSSMGLPGLNNFVGEILILLGTFQAAPLVAAAGFAGLLLTVVYVLSAIQQVLFGKARGEHALRDLTGREGLVLAALAAAVLLIGLHPGPLLDLLQGPAEELVRSLK
jgi:NADH-quinone oxidoreductase subunit M